MSLDDPRPVADAQGVTGLKRRRGWFARGCWCLALVALAFAVASAAAPGANRSRLDDPCPATGTIRPVADAQAVIAGAYLAIKRLFPRINYAQGRQEPVTRRTTLFQEVVQLADSSKDPLAFRRIASRSCGAATAGASWALVADFPLAPMATDSRFAFFLANTRSGWKLYGDVPDLH